MGRGRIYLMMAVLAMGSGCARSLSPGSGNSHARKASERLQGFMDGYNSAYPEQGYRRDEKAYHGHIPHHPGPAQFLRPRLGQRSPHRHQWRAPAAISALARPS